MRSIMTIPTIKEKNSFIVGPTDKVCLLSTETQCKIIKQSHLLREHGIYTSEILEFVNSPFIKIPNRLRIECKPLSRRKEFSECVVTPALISYLQQQNRLVDYPTHGFESYYKSPIPFILKEENYNLSYNQFMTHWNREEMWDKQAGKIILPKSERKRFFINAINKQRDRIVNFLSDLNKEKGTHSFEECINIQAKRLMNMSEDELRGGL